MASLTLPQLAEGLDRLHYELDQMYGTASVLFSVTVEAFASNTSERTGIVVRNAVVESFLLHVRTLQEFFSDSRKRPTDIRATDYVEGWDAESWRNLHEQCIRISKAMAHITTGPPAVRNKELWRIEELVDAFDAPVEPFCRTADLTPSERWKHPPRRSVFGPRGPEATTGGPVGATGPAGPDD